MSATQERPNVLLILDDQHRFDYMGCAGADFVRTPNMDRLARRGVRFTQCTTNCPVCAPARIGLASGLQPVRLGSLDNMSFLPHTTPTYYQRLRDHGYRVGCVGKLDLAKPNGYNGRLGDRPQNFAWGFTHPEECEGKMHAGMSPRPQGPYGFWLESRGAYEPFHNDYVKRRAKGWNAYASWDSVLETEEFEDTYIGRRAAEWIEQVPDDFPWHYFVSFVGPHDPFDPPTEYAERFRDADVPPAIQDSLGGKPAWQQQRKKDVDPEEIAHTRRQYCGSIEAIDDGIGRILDALETRGMVDNTIIIFSSDHGEMLGDHGFYAKCQAYEPSLRVPLIAAGPGIEEGLTSNALVELIDINPTICELAGLPPQEGIDARSFAPVLRGAAEDHRTETVSGIRNFRCIRTERYKFVANENDINELYDLQEDPSELNNLTGQLPEAERELAARLTARFVEGEHLR